jgi:hypothetical protein
LIETLIRLTKFHDTAKLIGGLRFCALAFHLYSIQSIPSQNPFQFQAVHFPFNYLKTRTKSSINSPSSRLLCLQLCKKALIRFITLRLKGERPHKFTKDEILLEGDVFLFQMAAPEERWQAY